MKTTLRYSIVVLFLITVALPSAFGQTVPVTQTAEQEILNLSREKWIWMAGKNADKLATLFHNKSKFVHMSGTWKKDEELEIIKTGRIWYKKAEVHDVAVETFDDTGIVWSRITLQAVVRDSEVSNQFTVTEVYRKDDNEWKLLALTFSSVRDTHVIAH
jgi:hypothetical protein